MYSCSGMRRLVSLLGVLALAPALAWSQGTYTTNFPLTENPISEGGKWIGGQSAGGNLWGNAQTTPGLAFGVSEPTQYGDPTAILTGSWGQTQTAAAVVKINVRPTGCCHEVEVHLRSTISTHNINGYEVLCPVHSNPGYGFQVVRWNGPNGDFVYLPCTGSLCSVAHQCVNGDVIKATASGTNPVTIVVNLNGSDVVTATDNGSAYNGPGGAAGPWTSGNPGIGFYDSQDNNWNYFGFSSFTATDGQGPAPPTNLTATPR
jgi:hypothetical protein